jgi:hypothetical protein
MEPTAPRRRGRPPRTDIVATNVVATNVAAAPKPPEAQPAEPPKENIAGAEAPRKRRRRSSVGGHALKLTAPARPGYSRRWVNDDKNRIANAEELGYDFVQDTGLKTSSPGSRISRLVGTKASGEPLHAFLMETPDELYAEGVAEKEAVNRQIDEAIVAGRDSTGQMSPTETYGQGSIKSDR